MFTADVNHALTAAADLINTSAGFQSAQQSQDTLQTVEDLTSFIHQYEAALGWSVSSANRTQLGKVRSLRNRLREVWHTAPMDNEADLEPINVLLKGVGSQLVPAGHSDEATFQEAPVPASTQLVDAIKANTALALAHVVVAEESSRLRICRGEDCEAALVDLTRNRSKLFCDFGNCANRAHVRAYRARQAAKAEPAKVTSNAHDVAGPPVSARRTKPSAAEKAEELAHPSTESAAAVKEFRDRMRSELMKKRKKKEKKAAKRAAKG